MSFRQVPKSVTLNDLEQRNGRSQMSPVSIWAIIGYDRRQSNIKVWVIFHCATTLVTVCLNLLKVPPMHFGVSSISQSLNGEALG